MEVTIDKFGRILIPKKLRILFGLRPGLKLKLNANQAEQKIALQIVADPDLIQVNITDFGLPVIQNGKPEEKEFDTIGFIKANREAYLDRKMGLE